MVVTLTVTATAWFGLSGLKVQFESVIAGELVQVYVSGRFVVVFPPVVLVNPFVLLTVRLTVAVCPCLTLIVPDARFEVIVKVWPLAVTVKPTVVWAETEPEVPLTVTLVAPAATLAATEIVTVVVPLPPVTVVGLKLHVMPVWFAQLKLTVPVKFEPLLGATVIVAVTLLPAVTVVGLIDPADKAKPPAVAAQASARLLTSTEPRPVTRL